MHGRAVASGLELSLSCLGADTCPVPAWREWPVEWDDVRVECRQENRRPDLLLCLNGEPTGAIEVFVSHEVTAEKAAELRALQLPWIEVRASDIRMDGPTPWTPNRPLPVRRASRDIGSWRCPGHEADRLLEDARVRYKALQQADTPQAAELIKQGRAIKATRENVQKLLAERDRVLADIAAEEAAIAEQLERLPAQIAEVERRLEVARSDLQIAERVAAERRGGLRPDAEQVELLQDQLRGLDAELAHVEGLRRRLSGLRPLGLPPGPRPVPHGRRTLLWCPIDVYRERDPLGRRNASRMIFRVDLVPVSGKHSELWLVEDSDALVHRVEADDDATESILFDALERRLDHWRAQGRIYPVILDRPCEWIPVPEGAGVPADAWDAVGGPVPRAYEWSESKGHWTLRASDPGAAPETVPNVLVDRTRDRI